MWRKTENRSDPTQDLKLNWHAEDIIETYFNEKTIACENIRFSLLFADGDVSLEERGETDVFAG